MCFGRLGPTVLVSFGWFWVCFFVSFGWLGLVLVSFGWLRVCVGQPWLVLALLWSALVGFGFVLVGLGWFWLCFG